MDKRKYQSKKLIAEFEHYRKDECFEDDTDSKFTEVAYRLKDGSIIIEYQGARFSHYGIATTFNRFIGRKGIFQISKQDYRIWRIVRKNDLHGEFIDWEGQIEEIMNMDSESLLKCAGNDKMPF